MHRRGLDGMTVRDVLVTVIIVWVLAALIVAWLKSVNRPGRTGRRMECSSHMRQVGLAIFQYEKEYGCMPNAQWNIYRRIGGYLGATEKTVVGPGSKGLTDVFRCPNDEYTPTGALWNYTSYAPLVDSGYLDGDDDGTPDGNFSYCAWSYCRTGYDKGDDGVDRDDDGFVDDPADAVWQTRNLTQIAPDTALLTEFWDPTNRLNFDIDVPPGTVRFDFVNDIDQGMPVIDFTGPAMKATLTKAADAGGYRFLSVFGYEAKEIAEPRPMGEVCHDGVINLLYTDGAVISEYLKDVTATSPHKTPAWTRTAD